MYCRFNSIVSSSITFISLAGTFAAQANKVKCIIEYPIIVVRAGCKLNRFHLLTGYIDNTSAFDASEMIVFVGIAVISLLPSPEIEPPDQPHFGQNIQITVHGSKTDTRHSLSDSIVNLVRSRMCIHTFQGFED